MDTDRINLLLNNPADATLEDIAFIESEIIKYPYSQMLHILLAKVEFQLVVADKNEKLGTAAIYASDRSILKQVITSNQYLEGISSVAPFQEIPGRTYNEQVAEESVPEQLNRDESASIFDEVLDNLEKLKSLREQFHHLEQTEEAREKKKKKKSKADKLAKKEEKKLKKAELDAELGGELEVEAEIVPDLEDELASDVHEKKKQQDELLEQDEEIDTQVNAYFLKEIEQTQPNVEEVAVDRHEVQKEIIEKFIKAQPSIGPIRQDAEKSTEESHKDLSEKSTKFGDDLVSENLAIILLKQGKKDRAIDIYKKLIWKLPQKKTYFAARIEEIKN